MSGRRPVNQHAVSQKAIENLRAMDSLALRETDGSAQPTPGVLL